MNNPHFIDHIVLIVKDIKKTTDFYNVFLGKPEHLNNDSVSYKIGNTKIFFGLPYKEYEFFDKDKGGINHLAFGVKTIEELKIFEEKLNNSQIKNSGIQIDKFGGNEFIWFDDPHGYRLEFYLRPVDKNFIGWITLKSKLDSKNKKPPLFKEGEIWWCSLGENIGVEINGKSKDFTRPVLVFKKLSNQGFLGIPMTTQTKSGNWYVSVRQSGKDAVVNLSQARVLSFKRMYSKIGELDDADCFLVYEAFLKLYVVSNKKFSPPDGGVVGKSQI